VIVASDITLLGAGCTGPLLALLLARRGHRVTVYERRPDARRVVLPAGRSINLALAARGITALERAGLMPVLAPLLVPMAGRRIHVGAHPTTFLPYGQRPEERLWSVGRAPLSEALVTAAEDEGVTFRFGHACRGADFERGVVHIEDLDGGGTIALPMQPVIAADGAGSALRGAMADAGLTVAREEPLGHAYKELSIPPNPDGAPRLEPDALHIWPRGGFMLIALPNADQSFTATLFLARTGPAPSFEALAEPAVARMWFASEFADAIEHMPEFDAEFAANPVGLLGTVLVDRWYVDGQALLIGDAAHAIVPFHGQGLNCAFEDCVRLDSVLQHQQHWPAAFAEFEASRSEDTRAIARMALENYVEMRDTVRDPRFALQKELSLALERRHPGRFVPRYSMVMFHAELPYSVAEQRGAIQQHILDEATATAARMEDMDWARLDAAVRERLAPLPGQGR
jgi:kynurenine 3-monooxygenase